jgi:hypothetical protein
MLLVVAVPLQVRRWWQAATPRPGSAPHTLGFAARPARAALVLFARQLSAAFMSPTGRPDPGWQIP